MWGGNIAVADGFSGCVRVGSFTVHRVATEFADQQAPPVLCDDARGEKHEVCDRCGAVGVKKILGSKGFERF